MIFLGGQKLNLKSIWKENQVRVVGRILRNGTPRMQRDSHPHAPEGITSKKGSFAIFIKLTNAQTLSSSHPTSDICSHVQGDM